MKYIKPFNEAFIQTVYNNWENIKAGDVREFAKDYLAYLFDSEEDGFRLDIYNSPGYDRISGPFTHISDERHLTQNTLIRFSKGSPKIESFSWNDIKDYFIPFLHFFINKYKLSNDNNPSGFIVTDPYTSINTDRSSGNRFFGNVREVKITIQFQIPSPGKRRYGVSYSDKEYSLEYVLSDKVNSIIFHKNLKPNWYGAFEEITSINIHLS
jgi:hypothetical protein